jgi:hypothetical protein
MHIESDFLDARLTKTGTALLNRMVSCKTSSIRDLSADRNQ